MAKQRKHGTPLQWEQEDSGQFEHPHTQVKIVGEKKIGQEPMGQDLEKSQEKKSKR